MAPEKQSVKKKKDKKPLYILLGFVSFFIIFIFLITRPSVQSKAIDEIQLCSNINDVKSVFERYKFELLETAENGNKVVSLEFQNVVRNKLNSFNLTEEEVKQCLIWLPPAPTSINLIVIPDLSRRIIDTFNNPRQIENDKFVLQTVWESFVSFTKLKQDSKDKLMVNVTDIDQAKGQFESIANNLIFDLSTHRGKSNRLFFTSKMDSQFSYSINKLYDSAMQKPLGADYRFYLRRYLVNHLKTPTLFDNYLNKVILITDGYLESEERPADTKIKGYEKLLYPAVLNGNILDIITLNNLNIPKVNIDLSNTEVLICEVNERREGRGYDFEILKAYWEDWFKRMNVRKKINFIQREQANELTAKKVKEFIVQ
jgi:hypothetical protein